MSKQVATEDVKAIFEEWQDERERMLALISAIEQLLCPAPNEDSPEFNAWKLSQVAVDMLGSARTLLFLKSQWGLTD
jgi:hypothetical protein